MKRYLLTLGIWIVIMISINAQPTLKKITANSTQIGLYERLEITIELTATFSNPYNYDQIELKGIFTSPLGRIDTVDGFYYQAYTRSGPPENLTAQNPPVWKIRFTPREIGGWSFSILCRDINGTTSSTHTNFDCISSSNPGFVRTANQNYLKTDNQQACFLIGENVGWYGSNKTYDYQNWMDELSRSGANFMRVWMCSWAFAIEWNNTPLGNYNNRQERAFQLDWVVEYARTRSIYIQLCLNNHGQVSTQVNPEWSSNPYNASNGGPCSKTSDFFTNATAKKYLKQRLRYIIARWGYATSILNWELFNEIDWTDQFDTFRIPIMLWHKEMANYIKEIDPYQHLVSTSYAQDIYDPGVWNLSSIDFTQFHHYSLSPDTQSNHYDITRNYLKSFNKPTIIGEFGFPGQEYYNDDPNGIDLHNSIWASSLSGAMGTACIWWWDNYIHPMHLYYHFRPLADYIKTVDLLTEIFTAEKAQCQSLSRTDLLLSPGYSWGKAPQSQFVIESNGSINPSSSNLGQYLFGSQWNTSLRNPPTFEIEYTQAGGFQVLTGPNTGTSPTVQIWLDGSKLLDQPGSVNTLYSIDVPAGKHLITVDNRGTDWISISAYIIPLYTDALHGMILKSQRQILGWIHHRNYNWQTVKNSGIPATIENARLLLDSLSLPGIFQVEWWDCTQGIVTHRDTVATTQNPIELVIPPLTWDYAFKMTWISNVAIDESHSTFDLPSHLMNNSPNPFSLSTEIRYYLAQPGRINLVIYNMAGQTVRNLDGDYQLKGHHQMVWDGRNQNQHESGNGIFFVSLTVNDKPVHLKTITLIK